MSRCLVVVALLLLALVGGKHSALAAPSPTGITVSPYIQQITLDASQTSVSYPIQLTNRDNNTVFIHVSVRNFTSLASNGAISFSSQGDNKHGLVKNINLADDTIVLGPNSSQSVLVNITDVKELAVGGHYGAIVFTVSHPNLQPGNNINIDQASASLIFLNTYGEGTQTTKLNTPLVGSFYVNYPKSLNAVITNSGNTQTTPRGSFEIRNSHGQVVSSGQLNVDSSLILPESKRLFVVDMQHTNKRLLPGVYHLTVSYRHDGQTSNQMYQASFLYVGAGLIISSLLYVVFAVLFVSYGLPWARKWARQRRKKAVKAALRNS